MKTRRKRLTPAQMREGAKKGSGGGNFLILPEGFEEWRGPDRPCTLKIDVLPYEVETNRHPDANVEKGTLWYKQMFTVHYGVGPNNLARVCPKSVGKKCPIHEDAKRLEAKGDIDEKVLKALYGRRFTVMNIKDPEDKTRVKVFCTGIGKFWVGKGGEGGLQQEISEGDDTIQNFWDVEGGKTLVCRFSQQVFEKNKYIACTKIDFRDRKDMDEAKTLRRTLCLDNIFNVLPYDRLKEEYLQTGDDEEASKNGKSLKGKKSKKPPEDTDDEMDDMEDEDVKPKKKGKKATKKSKASDDSEE